MGWGGGGMGWANNVHVGCRKDVMLRHATSFRCWSNFKWGGVGGGWGGLITFMSAAGRMWCYVMLRRSDVGVTSNGVGWGGMGWANNVHVGCRMDVMLRHATLWRCWSNFRDALDATLLETVSQPNFDGRWCKSMEWSCACWRKKTEN